MRETHAPDTQAALIWCPFADSGSAQEISAILVEERLVACANIIPSITSVFRWQDEVQSSNEAGVLFKTTQKLLDLAVTRLASLHPYDTPAIVGWHADDAAPATLKWLARQTAALEG